MKKLFAVIISSVLISLAALAGCSADEQTLSGKKVTFFLMDTYADIVVYDDFTSAAGDEKLTEFSAVAESLLREVENSLSATLSVSAVGRFNAAAAGEKVEVDKHAYEVLKLAKEAYGLTGGYYNPAVYYSVRAYGFNPYAPPETEPDGALMSKYADLASHFGETELSEENGAYYAVKPEYTVEEQGETLSLRIDLGGIGKGYASDLIAAKMTEYGYTMGYFGFGGSSYSFKKSKGGGTYHLGFTDPRQFAQTYFALDVSDTSVSTSADNENCYFKDWDGDGTVERYCHIMDPFTGKPVRTGVISATVIGGSAALNDAFTTAVMAMGADRAINFINDTLSALPDKRRVTFAVETSEGYKYYTNAEQGEYSVNTNVYSPY